MATSTPRFRPATPHDLDTVLDLMRTYYAEEGYPFTEGQARAQLHRLLATPELGSLCVAMVDGEVAGYLAVTLGFSLEYGGRDAFIDELFIAERFRGMGLGREAMEYAEAYCRRMDVRAIHLEVEPQRDTASGLYERSGFRATGRTLMTRRLEAESESDGSESGRDEA